MFPRDNGNHRAHHHELRLQSAKRHIDKETISWTRKGKIKHLEPISSTSNIAISSLNGENLEEVILDSECKESAEALKTLQVFSLKFSQMDRDLNFVFQFWEKQTTFPSATY